jgi:protein-disulfide isomerase
VIAANYALADKLKLNGTPSFLIGDRLLRGGRDLESLRAIVAEERANAKK